ncbi:hypothetical protein P8C59_008401 [Phyllachora maydis]|uniref:Uncharacterized protein n=1 Tax=Phyllachora maydis TaxID=1825666 RepID=A0AAD9MGT2_9PEZI|nr:hypothetical protein P8C59_008401 [Phyllachora maydis]
MKSTSSRFSFDMIGAAKQEKLLEERHRQREMDKNTSDPPEPRDRDSRFDDFDGDDMDYDAMMDDDGLEEAIPGINVDLADDTLDVDGDDDDDDDDDDDEAATDPDNDQENFAGFVFQRSNPAPALASPRTAGPGMPATPRDANGTAIGCAVTKEDTSSGPVDSALAWGEGGTGLGIRGLDTDMRQGGSQAEDLYFEDGLADELDFEHEGPKFDEALFDLDDTDQYGRPIPGAFAKAREHHVAQQREEASRKDAAAEVSPSPGVTASWPTPVPSAVPSAVPVVPDVSALPSQELEYQAALAEAAHKAADSGKFWRGSSSPGPADVVTITSPTDSAGSQSHTGAEVEAMDEYELDDDGIIAEANASALANDADGFYGREFGFFSAPAARQAGKAQASSRSAKNCLSVENLYQYASGGYFGPGGAGLGPDASGRLVSREPNLTPITERSEYSNRNSFMSLALSPPGLGSGGPGSDGRNSSLLQSPGLAQLAMMADDDKMSVSALLKLRNRAWGGSQASLASSREGSPRSDRGPATAADGPTSPWGAGGFGMNGRKNSAFSVWHSSDAGSASGSPTLTTGLSLPLPLSALASPVPGSQTSPSPAAVAGTCSPVLEDDETALEPASAGAVTDPGSQEFLLSDSVGELVRSPVDMDGSQQEAVPRKAGVVAMGHRHKRSADSIPYTMEEPEEEADGETRWVMERRRTAESGEDIGG